MNLTAIYRKNCEGIRPEDADVKVRRWPSRARNGKTPCTLKLSPALASAWMKTAEEAGVQPDELLHCLIEEHQNDPEVSAACETTGLTVADLRAIGLRRVLAEFKSTGHVTAGEPTKEAA